MAPGITDSRYSGPKTTPEGVRYNKTWLCYVCIELINRNTISPTGFLNYFAQQKDNLWCERTTN